MKKAILTVAIVFGGTYLCVAQNSILQDKQGETTLLTGQNTISVNAADASTKASFIFRKVPADKKEWFLGGSVKLGATDGVASILQGYEFNRDLDFSMVGGHYVTPSGGSTTSFLYYSAGLTNSSFNLIKQGSDNVLEKKVYHGYSAAIGFNSLTAIGIFKDEQGIKSSFVYGLSLKYGKVNNLDDLKSVSVYSIISEADGKTTTITETEKKKGYRGAYATASALKLNVDGYLFPKAIGGRFGFGGYVRSQLTGEQKRSNAGLGAVVGQDGAPANVVFGLLYQFNDIFSQTGSESNIFKRSGLNIVAGYSF